jgi:aromatic-L-amino-acid decarboxylase
VGLLERSDLLKIVTPPSLSLTVFRIDPAPNSLKNRVFALEELNDINKRFYGRLSARNDILLTQTILNGVFCIRLAIGAVRTESYHIQRAYDLLEKEAVLTLEAWERKE